MNISQIRQRATQFKSITSLTVEEFDTLLPKFESAWENYIRKYTFSGKVRTRKYQPKSAQGLLSIEEKLFFILSYQKTATLQDYHAASFSLSQDMANKWIHVLSPLLEKCLKDYRANQGNYQLHQGQTYALDGTERPIQRPAIDQQDAYSGKKHTHTCKNLLIVALTGFIVYLSPTIMGKAHDKSIADQYLKHFEKPIELLVDLGFQAYQPTGVKMEIPNKKTRGKPIHKIHQVSNRIKASRRVFVEHAIGHVKIMRSIKDKNRNTKYGFRHLLMKTAVALHNFRVACRRVIAL